MKKVLASMSVSVLASAALFTMQSCLDEYAPGNYYTFTGETVASLLESEEYKDDFTYFVEVLKRADIWGEMKTYGNYTCFAPTNDGFKEYFDEKGVSSVDELTDEQCDTIAFTHIIKSLFYCKDLVVGALPYPNMLDRYLIYNCDELRDADDTTKVKAVYRLNGQSRIIERDDSVVNGVVQIIDKVLNPTNKMLPDVIKVDPNIKIFSEALFATGLDQKLTGYIDAEYPQQRMEGNDSTDYSTTPCLYTTGYETERGIFAEKRYFKYTVFAEPDSVFLANNINGFDDLVLKAQEIYDEAYPEDADAYVLFPDPSNPDDLSCYKNPKHPLNRFVAYHLLPEQLTYDQFNVSQPEFTDYFVGWDYIDIEDFYETMMPHSIMRISYPVTGGRYINRKGARKADDGKGVTEKGVRIFTPSEDAVLKARIEGEDASTALNGVYHYIEDILAYSKHTREVTLNCRMRIMCNTLSPDFINSGARGRNNSDANGKWTMGYLDGFCTNVEKTEETELWVRYRNNTFTSFFGDEMTLRGIYDVTFRLPPVPTAGTYEIRMFVCAMSDESLANPIGDRGVVQYYLNGVPCGIPVDLRYNQTNPKVTGDGKTANKPETDEEIEEVNLKTKAMHSRGYMLAMDTYAAQGSINLCWDRNDCLRKIITTDYLYPDKDYYLRIRLVLDNPDACCPFNTLELVPKSIYQGDIPEDRH